MRLHYRGDLRGRIEGQEVGPDTTGMHYRIVRTEYDPATGLTTAHVVFSRMAGVRR